MTNKNYFMVLKTSNIVENVCVWDGDIKTWQPPAEYLMLEQDTTLAMNWTPVYIDEKLVDYVLTEVLGEGAVGYTWDGFVLITDDTKPNIPTPNENQPTTNLQVQ